VLLLKYFQGAQIMMGLSAIAIVLTSIPALFAFPHITIIQGTPFDWSRQASRARWQVKTKCGCRWNDGEINYETATDHRNVGNYGGLAWRWGTLPKQTILCHNYYTPKVQKNVNNSGQSTNLMGSK
jgi:hypothetical protein